MNIWRRFGADLMQIWNLHQVCTMFHQICAHCAWLFDFKKYLENVFKTCDDDVLGNLKHRSWSVPCVPRYKLNLWFSQMHKLYMYHMYKSWRTKSKTMKSISAIFKCTCTASSEVQVSSTSPKGYRLTGAVVPEVQSRNQSWKQSKISICKGSKIFFQDITIWRWGNAMPKVMTLFWTSKLFAQTWSPWTLMLGSGTKRFLLAHLSSLSCWSLSCDKASNAAMWMYEKAGILARFRHVKSQVHRYTSSFMSIIDTSQVYASPEYILVKPQVHTHKSSFMTTIDNSQVHAGLKYILVKSQAHRHKSSFKSNIDNSQVHAKASSTCKLNHKYIGLNQAHQYKHVFQKAVCKTQKYWNIFEKTLKNVRNFHFNVIWIYIGMQKVNFKFYVIFQSKNGTWFVYVNSCLCKFTNF